MNDENVKAYEFTAKIENVRFYSEETNYHILEFSTESDLPELKMKYGVPMGTLVGYCVRCIAGDYCKVKAKLIKNPKWGTQYEIISLSFDKPTDEETLYKFLSSVINENHAMVLHNAYPDIIDRVMQDNEFEPDYKILKGIGFKTWDKIRSKIIESFAYAELIALLAPIGCTLNMIKRIGGTCKDVALLKQKILSNPYILCDIPMLGFKKVDGFALQLKPELANSLFRVKACIEYLLKYEEDNSGNSYLTVSDLKKAFKTEIANDEAYEVLDDFLSSNGDEKFYLENERIGLRRTQVMEEYIFKKIKEMAETSTVWNLQYDTFFERMKNTSEKQGFYLSAEQIACVRSIADNNVTVVSGKAGTGKTSIIKAILEVYKDHSICMAALSAKAAKRMKEVTGFMGAKTIHRLLAYSPMGFMYNESCPLPYDLIIIDESSMVNVYLFFALLKAVANGAKIVLAGDFAQLPSIGVGSVFSDLIKYSVFNKHNLTKVYRQSDNSYIVDHANLIRESIMPFDIDRGNMMFGEDTLYLFRNEPEQIRDNAVNLFLELLKTTDIKNISIVCPRKDTVCVSCESINNIIQDRLLPVADSISLGKKVFKVGARVINRKNDYDSNILNGDLGTVISVDKGEFVVKFDEGDTVTFKKPSMATIDLAYAISVHSSQGSQYETCIVAMDMSSYTLLSCNMIYTAMTRAINKLIVISQPNAFTKAVGNEEENNRSTFLKIFLQSYDFENFQKSKMQGNTAKYMGEKDDKIQVLSVSTDCNFEDNDLPF